ncbi:MAG: DUF6122 family protein [Erythrobacter sp.]|uniref:DUF6122 family protein n=1 Tax=Erythrobacter sp. TaxID=1042 RepID=UPI00326325B6
MDGSIEHLQPILHYGGHWLAPLLIAWVVYRTDWRRFGAVMVASNVIDIDHLWAVPIFDPERCSIGFHTFHGWEAGIVYLALLLVPRWWARAFGVGALWHLCVDYGDCVMQSTL